MSGMEFGERDLLPGEAMTGKTEWEDALIKHGIQEAKVVQKNDDDLYQEDVERKEQMDPHAHKTMEQLDELEDDLEETVLEQYRQKRREALMAEARRNIYGQLFQIREQEYTQEVSKAAADTYVIVHLSANTEADCQVLNKLLVQVAAKHPYAKFCVIRAQEAIHNFPNHKCPTILVYYNGNIIKQIEKLGIFGGPRISAQSIEWVLAQPFTIRPAGAAEDVTHAILRTQLTDNPLNVANKLSLQKKRTNKGYSSDESDDDSDY